MGKSKELADSLSPGWSLSSVPGMCGCKLSHRTGAGTIVPSNGLVAGLWLEPMWPLQATVLRTLHGTLVGSMYLDGLMFVKHRLNLYPPM